MKTVRLFFLGMLLAVTCAPARAADKPTYQELEKRVAELEAAKAKTSEIANNALLALQQETAAKESLQKKCNLLEHQETASLRLIENLKAHNERLEAERKAERVLLDEALDSAKKTLDIATRYEKVVLVLQGQNEAYQAFISELHTRTKTNQRFLQRWDKVTTRKRLPLTNSLRENFLTIRWRFRSYNEELLKALEMLYESLIPEQERHGIPPMQPTPLAHPNTASL